MTTTKSIIAIALFLSLAACTNGGGGCHLDQYLQRKECRLPRGKEMGRNKRFDISLKRIYDAPFETDGLRILVERLWPRGLSKDKASIDHWLQAIAPSPELRRWYGHRPDRWAEFQARYLIELDANADAVRALKTLCSAGPVTFVYAARDTERNGAVVLKRYLVADRACAF